MPDEQKPAKCCCSGRRWLAVAAGAAGLYLFWKNRRYFSNQAIHTGTDEEYPEILAQVFAFPPEQVHAAALEACRSLPGWEVEASADAVIHAHAEAGALGHAGEVLIHFTPLRQGSLTKVSLTAALHGQGPELGANAQAIRAFQQRLAALLPSGGEEHAD